MNKILILISLLLFATTSASLAHILSIPVLYGAIIGVLIGAIPALLNIILKKRSQNSDLALLSERFSLCILFVITITITWQALVPLYTGTQTQIEKIIPLLLTTAALYTFYLILNQTGIVKRKMSMTQKLAILFSGPPLVLTFMMSITITSYILLLIDYAQLNYPAWEFIAIKFLDRGIIPPLTLLLFFWAILLLTNKSYTLRREKRFLLDKEKNKSSALLQTYYQALQDSGNSSPDNYLDILWKKSADFYIIPRYINWAIPILGFIGTVLGISLAADGIQRIINTGKNVAQLSSDLGQAISPLGIAFDTTLIALSLSVFLMLIQTALQRWEDNLLLDYENRIRNMPINTL